MLEINLILGCMFSGKSTALITEGRKRLHSLKNGRVIYVNHALDTRYGHDVVCAHSGICERAICVSDLNELERNEDFLRADVVCIDEIQFFSGVKNFITKWNKIFYIAGLSGDSNLNLFGEIYTLIPIADTIRKEYGYCYNCGAPASFTKKLSSNTLSQIDVGVSQYRACCRQCHSI